MDSSFLLIIEIIGTFAFAISGIRLAAYKNFDLFGAYTVGLVTAIGGGTLRDVLLDIPVFWMQTWVYLGVTGIALAIVVVFRKLLVSMNKTLFIFDTVECGSVCGDRNTKIPCRRLPDVGGHGHGRDRPVRLAAW